MKSKAGKNTRLKVLMVEDNADEADLLQKSLGEVASALFDLTHVERLEEALQRVREESFDAVLLDLSLPDSQGMETISKVTQAAPAIPIVVLTGLDDENVGLEAIRKGAQDYLVKGKVDSGLVSRVIRYSRERKWAEQQFKEAISELAKSRQELLNSIVEVNKSHAQLKVAQLELIEAAKMESVGRLAAGIAHEVKNPLATLVVGLDYLQSHVTGNNDKLKEIVKNMTDAALRADAIISRLQEFSTTEVLETKVADLGAIGEQALSLMAHELTNRSIRVKQELERDLPTLWLDANKIEQVFINVLMNAVEAMPHDGTLTVRIYSKQLDAQEALQLGGTRPDGHFGTGSHVVVVEVEDTGTGIAEDNLDKVFDPFFTTKEPGRGMGLGLTVARKIVEMHGGRMNAKNQEPRGVRVTILFKT